MRRGSDIPDKGLYFDVLQELGNIGSSYAITALTKMLGRARAKIYLPKINLLPLADAAKIVGSPEEQSFGILVSISGDIEGLIITVIRAAQAKSLIRYLIDTKDGDGDLFTEMDMSALEEMGNILSTSYLNALSALTGAVIRPSVPYVSRDMSGAILSVPATEFSKVADKVLFIETVFGEGEDSVSAYFFLVPEISSFDTLLSSFESGK
jgi:chemotaxis protein CheC